MFCVIEGVSEYVGICLAEYSYVMWVKVHASDLLVVRAIYGDGGREFYFYRGIKGGEHYV